MIFRNRAIAYVGAGAAGLLAAGAFAAPALAANSADLEIKAAGTTIAVGASGKDATVSLINNSDVDAKGILVGLDISKLDTTLVDIDESGCNPREAGVILCGIEGDTIGAGKDIDWAFPLTRNGNATGPAGSITVFIEHEGTDPDEKNNSATVEVNVEGSGPDLSVFAPDVEKAVTVGTDGRIEAAGDLHAGETAALYYQIGNYGDEPAAGLKITVKLPEGTTFTEVEPDCKYADDNTSVVCTYETLRLIPRDQDKSDDDEEYSAGKFVNLITVGADVKAGSLTGGTVSVEPIMAVPGIATSAIPSVMPKGATGIQAADVDASDNTDGYAVIVAAEGGAEGGAGGGAGGGLPVTGPQAGLIGGIGVAVLAAGGAMFLVARRRRVVLVTPGDEKSTD